jgi:hypothetical protein
MARELRTDWTPSTERRLGQGQNVPLSYNVPRLDTFLQGKTRLWGALQTFATIAILLLLAIALGVLRVHLYWPVDT